MDERATLSDWEAPMCLAGVRFRTPLKRRGAISRLFIQQIVQRILLLLEPLDRLDAALTCRRWAEAITMASLLDDLWLVICGSWMAKALSALLKSKRQYRNLRLYRGT